MKALLLSPKQSKFVQAIVNGATYADAYKRAGFTVPSGAKGVIVARSNASKIVARNANVRSAIKEARDEIIERAKLDATDLVLRLEQCREVALEANPPQVSAAVAAVMGIAKLLGLAVDRSEAHVVMHKPAPLPTTLVELSEEEWKRQFDPSVRQLEPPPEPRSDFLD